MGIQPQMLTIRIGMDIVITSTDKLRIDTGRETRVALENATGHGLLNMCVSRWQFKDGWG